MMFVASAKRTTATRPPMGMPQPGKAPRLIVVRSPAQEIMHRVAQEYRLSVAEMLAPNRRSWAYKARRRAILEVYAKVRLSGQPLSLAALGRLFKRDHTTILHLLQKAGVR